MGTHVAPEDTSGRCGDARIRAAPAGMHHRKASRAGQDNRYAIGKAKHDGHLRLCANDGIGPLGNAGAHRVENGCIGRIDYDDIVSMNLIGH